MHLHILGICGTFMGGLALIARSAGHTVTGCDAGVYPPMSTQLEEQGIRLVEGYGADQLALKPDLFIIGNVVTRGNPLMEAILDQGLPYVSGPQWLGEQVLRGQHVLAVAGTHGKTTTSSMLAWILDYAGHAPNFLIGGVAPGLKVSARYTPASKLFVIEADEYDTAFFDKRSKFVHYRPRTAILNNLEYDHADIFPDLAAIETQFHHLVRTVPASGLVLRPSQCEALDRVLARGCWTPVQTFGDDGDWRMRSATGDHFEVLRANSDTPHAPVAPKATDTNKAPATTLGTVRWQLTGEHNRMNGLAAVAAAVHAGVPAALAIEALSSFSGVKRRMEVRGTVDGIMVYDDFAHHPTAIDTTLRGLRARDGAGRRIIAVLEPRSNTMKLGAMAARLPGALDTADLVFCYGETQGKHALGWDPAQILAPLGKRATAWTDLDKMVDAIRSVAQTGDAIVIMSNGSFGGVHQKLLDALARDRAAASGQ
ncbi:UDP-N-acetylmuramate:L-alanyl-gamma-D-glutamyl-meso-diaminopimelate ligase [Paracandidimonas lactea]|uniref:UDP-N-acetylmuramate:L-alanyl-gamma-D-glutamyl- meso-diaminopimelate ligase n=1 Tax=Paracandidimonas lactea TaxID=2895524 RepID=UPI001F007C3D|nr:UDP-N-acetylmuramate:L-alanyl-gamma-D-glutamyl-meso-diaminopimelate ligase [Paracandidimonas lactea]